MRKLVVIVVVCLGSAALLGCGGPPFEGSLTGRYGDGTKTITAPATQAQITSLSPSTINAGSASFTLAVTGINLAPATIVMWDNGNPLATTYVSPTLLRATVPAALIRSPGSTTVTPSPTGTFNFGSVFTVSPAQLTGNKSFVISSVAVQANDMVASPSAASLYLSVASADATRPNTLAALDPQSGRFGSSVAIGLNPGKLAVSQDGNYLYTSLKDIPGLRRFMLPSLQFDINIPLGVGPNTNYVATDLAVQPTNSRTIAVARTALDNRYAVQADVVILDDTSPRAQTATSGSNLQINNLAWNSNGQALYGYSSATGLFLYPLSVTSAGVQAQPTLQVKISTAGSFHFGSATGHLYSDIGAVLDPVTAANIDNFPVNALQSGFTTVPLMIPDSTLKIAYFLGRTIDGPGAGSYVIEAFDLTHFNLLGTASIPNVSGTPVRFARWGSNGLAFLTIDPTGKGGPAGVYVVTGDFVTSPAQ